MPKSFISDFYKIAEEKYDDNDIVIDFDVVVKWLNIRKDNLKKILVDNFNVGSDYTLEVKKIIKKDGGATRKNIIFITSDCFKTLCMISQAKNAKLVRKYFLEMEKLVRQYHKEIQEKIKKELDLVKANQKPKNKNPIKGKVYVFEALNTKDTLYKLGMSDDLEKRLKTYNTGLANDLVILFELEVDDIEVVESCAKLYLKKYQYRKRREVYDVNLEIISGMLERCDVFTEATEKFFESHKKEFKKGAQRMKNKKGKFYLFFVENK